MKKTLKKLSLNKKTISSLTVGSSRRVRGGSGCYCLQDPTGPEATDECGGGLESGTGGGGGTGLTCYSCVGVSCEVICPETVTGDPYKLCHYCER